MDGTLITLLVTTAILLSLTWWLLRLFERAAEADWGSRWVNRIDGFGRIFCYRYHRLKSSRLQLPESGPAIIVANHISGIDPFLLIASSRRPIRFIVASEQYYRFGLQWMFRVSGCIPVDRSGKPERAFREALKALQAGEVVGIFPHGTIHLESDPPRKMKSGAVKLAQLAGCEIYPARIDGVRAEGDVFLPALLRGNATVESFAPISCEGREVRECLGEIERVVVRETG
ncbi:MAG: 1-acyl-sn-glycerol-3-phosphate acyltransferase [Chromatiales bacterium]|nr:1-acyl-sn-glycerol-3-phosphate acyltransferase [Chromatiales bacterium]